MLAVEEFQRKIWELSIKANPSHSFDNGVDYAKHKVLKQVPLSMEQIPSSELVKIINCIQKEITETKKIYGDDWEWYGEFLEGYIQGLEVIEKWLKENVSQ